MSRIPVILDCDPGIDDAVAIGYALADPKIDVRLITTVSGNVNVDKTTVNARLLVGLCDKEVKIAQGAAEPLMTKALYAEHVHGKNGLGNYKFENPIMADLSKDTAVEAMAKELKHCKNKTTIIAIGPLTNVAKLLMLYPEIKNKIEAISIMGGGLKGGNATMSAEFNILVDPEAAKFVFDQDIKIIMAGLDVTEKTGINNESLKELAKTSHVGKVLSDILMTSQNKGFYEERFLHDVVSVMAVSNSDLFEYEKLKVRVETSGHYTRGMTVADRRKINPEEGKTKVLLDLDRDKFFGQLKNTLKRYK